MNKSSIPIVIDSLEKESQYLHKTPNKHSLVALWWLKDFRGGFQDLSKRYTLGLYHIVLKSGVSGKMGYGDREYDFTQGKLVFLSPGQVINAHNAKVEEDSKGWSLVFHPDLIRGTSLSKRIESFSFFSYNVSDALYLSNKEEENLTTLVQKIADEIEEGNDEYSNKLICSIIELILDYSNRYYKRQFSIQKHSSETSVLHFYELVRSYFNSGLAVQNGLPSVSYFSEILNVTPKHLSDLLKKQTGEGAQELIHKQIIDLAKEKLLATNDTVTEIAYSLGFEYPQHFSKLFKKKVGKTPRSFRKIN